MAINSLSSSSHGLSGLVSGMDTQTMVDAMLKGTQTKIDKQMAKKTQLTYKQEMYRTVISQLKSFQDTFFKFGSGSTTNLYDSSFYNTMAASTTSSAFRVSASTSARAGTTKIDYIKQLAKATSKKSETAATAPLEGEFDAAALKRLKESAKSDITFTVGDKTVQINDLNALLGGRQVGGKLTPLTNAEIADTLNAEFDRQLAGSDKKINATYENGKFTFKATGAGDQGEKMTITGTGIKFFHSEAKTLTTGADGVLSAKGNLAALQPNVQVTLNGVTKDISFDYNSDSIADVGASLQDSLTKAFGPEVRVAMSGGKLAFSAAPSSELKITGTADSMRMLGIKSGQSTKINLDMSVKDLNFDTAVYGNNFRFQINGVDFNVTADRSLTDIVNEINASDANVKISYSRLDDKFTIESKMMGAGTDIQMSQSEGNLLSALFGNNAVSGGQTSTGSNLESHVGLGGTKGDFFLKVPDAADPTDPSKAKNFESGSITLTINGKAKTFKIPAVVEKDADGKPVKDANGKDKLVPYTAQTLTEELNKQLGKPMVKPTAVKRISALAWARMAR